MAKCLQCESNVLNYSYYNQLLSFHNIVTSEDAGRVWNCVENAISLMAEEEEEEEEETDE